MNILDEWNQTIINSKLETEIYAIKEIVDALQEKITALEKQINNKEEK